MIDSALTPSQGKRYLTIRQTAQAYPALTESALRWLRFNGDVNGFNLRSRRRPQTSDRR
jgi:hypothetical protein